MRKRNPACYVWFLTSLLRLLRGGIRKALCEGHSCSGSAQLPHLGAQAELRGPVREAAEGLLPWEKTDCPLELSKEEEELMGGAWVAPWAISFRIVGEAFLYGNQPKLGQGAVLCRCGDQFVPVHMCACPSHLTVKIPHHPGSCPVQGKPGQLVNSFCMGSSGWSTPGLRESSLGRPGMQSHLQGNLALQSLSQGKQQSLSCHRLHIQARWQGV